MFWKVFLHEVSMVGLGLCFFCCLVISILKLSSGMVDVIEWEMMMLGSSSIVFTMVLDWVSMIFMCFVFLISSSVMYYSGAYMKGDENFNRFMYLVLLFVFSMMMMILSPNLISILLGWDGLGLVSYALVIYYQNEKSANAGMLTILSNRVGDVAILLGIGVMSSLGSWNFFIYSFYMNDDWLLLKIFLVLAAMTKSAQIPFSAWLPAAMAAPTPVSALVHSSTLVTAGVYLMIRFSPALISSSTQSVLLIVSCTTMFMAGLGANFEYDLKKIIALSTLSQLGVMLSILSLGYCELAFFHLLSHALFKALLFMCAGAVIHSVGNYQDIRFMGGLVYYMPLTVSYMSIANLSLCGFPFLAGFYSKDLILEVAFMSWINFIAFILYVLSTGLTVSYTSRLIYYSLTSEYKLMSFNNVSDNDYTMGSSMTFLLLGTIFGGALLSWLIFPYPVMICLSGLMKSLVLIVCILGGIVGYLLNLLSVTNNLKSMNFYNIVVLMGSMWFMPFLSSYNNSNVSLMLGSILQKLGDNGWYEYFGSQGIYLLFYKGFIMLNNVQINNVKVFMKMFIISVIVVLFVYM